MKPFSTRIKQLRKARNLSQDQLAYLVDTTQATISKYELEGLEHDLLMLKKLCEALETSADFLIGLTAKNEKPPSGSGTGFPQI